MTLQQSHSRYYGIHHTKKKKTHTTTENVADNKNNADPFFQFLWHCSPSLFQSVNQADCLEVLRHVRDVAQLTQHC